MSEYTFPYNTTPEEDRLVVYLAGPMTGYPRWNFDAFDHYRDLLKSKGWSVISPADLDREIGFDPDTSSFTNEMKRSALTRDVEALKDCHAIALMPGWENSRGVAFELAAARFLGLQEIDATTGEPMEYEAKPTVPVSEEPSDWEMTPSDPGNKYEGIDLDDYKIKDGFITKDSGVRETMGTGSQRDTREGKGRYDLLNPMVLKRDAGLYERGSKKYNPRNWELGQSMSRYLDSAIRHLFQHLEGDRTEDHLAAVRWNCAGVMYTEEMISRGLLPESLDDRPNFTDGSHLPKIKAANEAKQ